MQRHSLYCNVHVTNKGVFIFFYACIDMFILLIYCVFVANASADYFLSSFFQCKVHKNNNKFSIRNETEAWHIKIAI